jgi:hypothetical protein
MAPVSRSQVVEQSGHLGVEHQMEIFHITLLQDLQESEQ